MTSSPCSLRRFVALSVLLLGLAGCGGGGGGGDTPPPQETFPPSGSLANVCTADGQKAFIRSYMDEVYLWYDEIPTVNAAAYGDVASYFDALRVVTPDAAGLPKDRFSAALPISGSGSSAPSAYGRPQGDATLMAQGSSAVPLVRVVTSPRGRRAGYLLFLDHEAGAQDDLIAAVEQLRGQAIQDLVLDLRYNSGGYLYVALSAASMITGPQSEGLLFEQLRYNDKRAAETASSFLLFSSRVQYGETVYPRGATLPQLDLPRVYILATALTCSASESIINSLRGIDVEVVLIGQTTCGKPYGFRRRDNCGYAFFPIEFQGYNAKSFGDYTAGFAPTCRVSSGNGTLGAPDEPMLAAALGHMDTGLCPAATATQSARLSAAPDVPPAGVNRRPPWAGRLLPDR